MAYQRRTRDQHFNDGGPKRILALDGGGLRGILALGILKQVEEELRTRHGSDPAFRLCHYFDLIAGCPSPKRLRGLRRDILDKAVMRALHISDHVECDVASLNVRSIERNGVGDTC